MGEEMGKRKGNRIVSCKMRNGKWMQAFWETTQLYRAVFDNTINLATEFLVKKNQ